MSRRLTVLSIDWDYFFPDPAWYDWGHNEENSLFYEMIWSTRPGNRNLRTGAEAYESFVPDRALMDGFWNRVLSKDNFPVIYVMESHKSLGQALLPHAANYEIWNFDQHHDLGYDDRTGMDCGNWARRVLEKKRRSVIHQVYPPWRADNGEKMTDFGKRVTVAYSFDRKPLDPDVVFVCRSSCWTPSWADEDWLEFLKPLQALGSGYPWQDRTTVEFVTKAREPGRSQAKVLACQWNEMVKASGMLAAK